MKIIINLLFYVFIVIFVLQILLLIIPFEELIAYRKRPHSLRLLDRHGTLLHVLPLNNGHRREYTAYKDIPEPILKILIRSEDKRFFYHNGIDILAGIRALFLNLSKGDVVSGASTITMQLARIVVPHNRGIAGKIQEVLHALLLESKCSKEEIFELWINSISFGMNTVGIASSCKAYFHKDLEYLTELEACLLAVVMRNPSYYNPFTMPEKLIKAAGKLARQTGLEAGTGIENELGNILTGLKPYSWPFHTPHFSLFVKNNLSAQDMADGWDIKTSLDLDFTTMIEKKIRHTLIKHHDNRLTNGAALVLNNNTGEILAYIGSNSFYDEKNSGQIDGVHVRNQPGSCLKPFLYAYALDSGFLPNTLLPDIPTNFGKDEIYTPANFNNRFHGPVRLRVALASSLNVPAVYTITKLGVENFRQKLIELGFDSLNNGTQSYGSGLALGNAEVTLFELTRAFGIFPANGKKINPVWKYKEKPGTEQGARVFSTYTSALISDILSDNASRALGFTTNSVLNTGFRAMFKTGTSDQFGNIWALGATTRYTVGIWLGNFSGETVIGMPGSSIPARIVVDILKLLDNYPAHFPLPENIVKTRICSLSGELATSMCPGTLIEYLPLNRKIDPCSFHFQENGLVKIQYPPLYSTWASNRLGEEDSFLTGNEDTITAIGTDQGNSSPYIRQPADGEVFYIDPSIPLNQQAVKVEIIHNKKDDHLTVFVNGEKQADVVYPFTWIFRLKKGGWRITVEDSDSSDSVRIMVR